VTAAAPPPVQSGGRRARVAHARHLHPTFADAADGAVNQWDRPPVAPPALIFWVANVVRTQSSRAAMLDQAERLVRLVVLGNGHVSERGPGRVVRASTVTHPPNKKSCRQPGEAGRPPAWYQPGHAPSTSGWPVQHSPAGRGDPAVAPSSAAAKAHYALVFFLGWPVACGPSPATPLHLSAWALLRGGSGMHEQAIQFPPGPGRRRRRGCSGQEPGRETGNGPAGCWGAPRQQSLALGWPGPIPNNERG